MAELSDTVQARREVGADAALAIVGTDLGRQSMTAITAKLAELRAEEAGLLTRRRYAAEYAEGVARWVALGCAGLAVALLALAGRLLARERARARDLLATLDLGVFMARDPGGEIRFWSEGCARLYGWTAAEAVGQASQVLLRTVFPQPLAEVAAALERDGAWQGDLRHRRRDGGEVVVAARMVLRRDWQRRPSAVLESFADVTAQRRAEVALGDSEARLRQALEAGQIGTFDCDLRRGELRWDARLRAVWALPPDTALSPEVFQAWLQPADRARLAAATAAACDPAGDGRYEAEYRAVGRLDGVERHVAERGRVQFAGGRAVRITGTVADVSAQRQAEAVLARDKAELERLVRERTRDLRVAKVRLTQAQRMEALGQISGGIAHDFNNVLQAVLGGAALIDRRPENPEGVRRLARMVAEAAGRGTAITRRLLAFSRQGELRPEPTDVAALLHDLRETIAHGLGAGIEIRVEVPAGLPPLLVDKGQLETALVNLATNARDAMAGTGVLTLAAGPAPPDDDMVRDAGLLPGRFLCLSVADTGSGMDAATLARAAEPFFTTKGLRRGTGLGLAMARGFAEQSGGAIHLESAPGRGTVVRLWFPAGETAPARAQATDTRHGARQDRARIMLVDDEAIVCEITAEQLEVEGFAVLRAASGPAALALLDAGEGVDLMVSDLSMPGMDGLALVREAQRRRPGLPAILLTGYATNAAEIAVAGAVSGNFSLLRKPVDGTALAERVAEMLEGAAANA